MPYHAPCNRYDAGDTIKVLFLTCFSLSNLAWALLSFPSGFMSTNSTARARAAIAWGADFVSAARYEPGSFVAYTSAPGQLNETHDWWGRPEDIQVGRHCTGEV